METLDHLNGYSRYVWDSGPSHDISGFDGNAWNDQNGIATLVDLPSLHADAVTQAYVARDGWWNASDAADMKVLEQRTDDDTLVDVVRITPGGGSPIDVWLDHSTSLIRRLVAHTEAGDQVTEDSNWRSVGAVKFPFRQVVTEATGATMIENAEAVAVDATAVPSSTFARPISPPLGSIEGASTTTIPFQFDGAATGHIVIDADFNGKPAKADFDSAGGNYLVPEAAKRMGLAAGGGASIGGVGNSGVSASYVSVKTIALGAARLHEQIAIVGPLPDQAIHPKPGLIVDGLIGFEMLTQFRTTIDYVIQSVTLSRFSDSPQPGAALPFVSDGRSLYVEAMVNGAKGLFRVDTGDIGALTVFQKFADDHGLFRTGGVPSGSVGGIGGTLAAREFKGKTFSIAGIDMPAPFVNVIDAQSGAFLSRAIAGSLGEGVLRRFKLTFDHLARTITFVPNRNLDEPFRSTALRR